MNLRETTYQDYKHYIEKRIIPEIGRIPLSKLSPMHIQNLYRQKLQNGRLREEGGLAKSTG